MFIRYFADTSGSALSYAALEYLRSFLRLAPVRLASVTGALQGRWQGYSQLLITPMIGTMINAVCCDPSRWTWIEKIPMADRPVDHRQMTEGGELAVPAPTEVVQGRVELYTANVRNILFACAPPRSKAELESALRYEALVVPTSVNHAGWRVNGARPKTIPVPVIDHTVMLDVFTPEIGGRS